jgi:hypothetical protein
VVSRRWSAVGFAGCPVEGFGGVGDQAAAAAFDGAGGAGEQVGGGRRHGGRGARIGCDQVLQVVGCVCSAALSVVDDVADAGLEEFRVEYVAEDGTQRWVGLADAWAVRFEAMGPARRFTARKGQRHLPGRWWSSTVGGHVGYESWLERDHVMLLDFDPAVVGIASQPFWLSWMAPDGRGVAHAPDYFARRVDGSAVVVDCRPVERRPARDLAKFDATRQACELLGWEYRLVGAADSILVRNVRWLAGYRHPRHSAPGSSEPSLEAHLAAFAEPAPLMATAESIGDPIAVLPVLYHVLWRGVLVTDLSVPLHEASMVTRGPVV